MNWFGSGLIPILIYASAGEIIADQTAILTENNLNVLTESSQDIETES